MIYCDLTKATEVLKYLKQQMHVIQRVSVQRSSCNYIFNKYFFSVILDIIMCQYCKTDQL